MMNGRPSTTAWPSSPCFGVKRSGVEVQILRSLGYGPQLRRVMAESCNRFPLEHEEIP